MHIVFHGAAKTVTGSCHLLEVNELKILLDCGFYQGKGSEMSMINRHFSFDPKEIDYVILTHAHIDHSGNLPNLVKKGFKGKIFATPATFELAEIMLMDSAKIQMADMEYLNNKRSKAGKSILEPIYIDTDVAECLSLFEVVDFHENIELNDQVKFNFSHTGHIIGSGAVHITVSGKNKEPDKILTYTGDLGRYNNRILKYPDELPQSDYLILESTYGDRKHASTQDVEEKMLKLVYETCYAKNGNLIIPAFSIGRTQEIVYILNNLAESGQIPKLEVFVDSPMSTNATEIMRKYHNEFNEEISKVMQSDPDPFGFKKLKYIRDHRESIALNYKKGPCIIIASSGMMEGGRIKHHLKHNIEDERNTILITGYCEPSTLGGRLIEGDKQVSIFGQLYDVNANVLVMKELSAHADVDELIRYVSNQDRNRLKDIFLVHGLPESLENLSLRLTEENFKSIKIPDRHVGYDLK